jgi:hypothetical protein
MFRQIKSWPNTLSKVFIVLIIAWVLLTGIGQAIEGQTELPLPADPSDATSKTTDVTSSDADRDESQQTPPPLDENKPTTVGKWVQRYEKLVEGINEESLGYEDADIFYQEVDAALQNMRTHLRDSLADLTLDQPQRSRVSPEKTDSESPKEMAAGQEPKDTTSLLQQDETDVDKFRIIEELQSELATLYDIRVHVVQLVSPGFRNMVSGTGVDGVQSFKEEIEYLVLMFRIRLLLLPQVGLRVADDILSAPTPFLLLIVKLAIAFVVFLWWRRWAFKTFPRVRRKILDNKPLQSIHKWLAKFLWYLIRVRKPLEWGILLWVLYNIIGTGEGQAIYKIFWTKAKWILTVWFALSFIGEGTSSRGTQGQKINTANLRLRSIRIIAAWVLVAGLGLSIAEDLAGKGTIYAWVWIFSKLLALPVLFLFIRWRREDIYRKLEEVPQQPAYVQKILQHKRGLRSFLGAVFGAIYLFVNGFRQWVLRVVTAFEGGRYFIANLTRLEAMRVSERMSQKIDGDPISDEIRRRLYADEGGFVKSAGQESLERITHLVDQGRSGMAGVVAEQGGGKTYFLKRLDSRFEGKMILFDCPSGGIDAFQRKFAETIGLKTSDLTTEAISARLQDSQIRVIAIDNLHRMSRPAFGGQRDMDQIAGLVSSFQSDVFWLLGVNWAAWHYISRVRESQLFMDDVLRIKLWTEAQIKELIELRSAHAGIEPDFGELILPRQFEDIDYDTVEERNRFGFYRILWNASDGNPMVSLQLWADSLRIAPDGRIQVSLPQLPATSELEKVNMTVLLTLRVIAQSEMASQEEITDSLRFKTKEVAGALNMATTNGWIKPVNGRYRLTWKWFRSITRVLARKNLLVRTTLGG